MAKSSLNKNPKDVTDEEWKQILEAEEYTVTREAGTERPFTGKYNKFVKDGKYYCLCCGALLFSSETKYESGCGWPAFWAAEGAVGSNETNTNIVRLIDQSHAMRRVEVRCKQITMEEWLSYWSGFVAKSKLSNDGWPVDASWIKEYMNFWFDFMDTSGDGVIDENEYTEVFTHFGLTDKQARETFKKITSKSISRSDFSRFWIQYMTSDDKNVPGNFIFGCIN